ncbi:S1 family peptidase [Aquisphaera insulae]|uniref:S1 family peptidase n=1 Tax=Aquisphaera insulae TaxID=2712864 RepID=UPI0013EB64BB|nr:serine protease [Aquisphaera insulae]
MRFWSPILVTFVVAGWARAEDTIPRETLSRIKACTVFVKAAMGAAEATGSGFVIRVDGNVAYVATNHHVVHPREDIPRARAALTLVFDSGTRNERSARGELLASDPERDLAIVKVSGVTNLPKPIDPAKPAEIVETMPVVTFGFPFGKMLATSRKNPAITVGRGTVSSLRSDDQGELAVVQIDGALNPGNSGGPVVDVNGKLVGIAVATIRGAQQIGLVIPQEQLVKMLAGRVSASGIRIVKADGDKVELDVEVELIDPLNRITDVAILYLVGDTTSILARHVAGEKWNPLDGSQRVPLTVSGAKATGRLSLTLPSFGPRRVTYQVVYTNGTGTVAYLQPALQPISQAGPTRNDRARAMAAMPPRRLPGGAPSRIARGAPYAAMRKSAKLDVFMGAAVDPKAKVAFTSTPQGFLKQYSYPDFELSGSFKLPGPATSLALDAARGRLYAIVTTVAELKFDHPTRDPGGKGDLHVYHVESLLKGNAAGTTELAPASTISLGQNVVRMLLSPDGRYLYLLEALTDAQKAPARLVRIDIEKGAADLELDLNQGAEAISMPPAGGSLYVAISPRGHDAYAFNTPEEGTIYAVNPETFEVATKALIEIDPADIQANDQGQVYVCGGSNQHTAIAVVDMKKSRAITNRWPGVYMGASIRLSHDQKRLYVATRRLSPATVNCWDLPARADDAPTVTEVSTGIDTALGGEIFLTPDDDFVLTRFGAVVPLGTHNEAGTKEPETPRPRRLSPR